VSGREIQKPLNILSHAETAEFAEHSNPLWKTGRIIKKGYQK